MKLIRKILNWIALILFLGGIGFIAIAYFSNRSFISYIGKLISDAKFGKTLKHMLFGVLAIFVAFILMLISNRINGRIRRKEKEEKERVVAEAAKLKKEAENAKIEAEQAKLEAQQAQYQLQANNLATEEKIPEETTTEQSEEKVEAEQQ